jgi:hypothetical protein
MSTDLDDLRATAEQISERKALELQRDKLIVAKRLAGHPWQEIATAAGLSFQATQTAAKRANKNKLPQPKASTLKPGARIVG